MNSLKSKIDAETAAGIIGTTLFVLILVAFVIFGPIVVLWSINTLFPIAAIPYNFFTWLAVVVLYLVSKSSVSVKN